MPTRSPRWTGCGPERSAGERHRLEVDEAALMDVLQAATGAGARVLSVTPVRQSLEEYFFQHMGDTAREEPVVPGRLSRIRAVAANTFRETVRERVLYNLVIFAILMTLSGLLLGQLSIRQDERIIKNIGLASMDIFGTLIAIFIGVGLVSKEIERRSLYPLLAKPLGRDEFLLGKFVGLGVTLVVNVGVMTAGPLRDPARDEARLRRQPPEGHLPDPPQPPPDRGPGPLVLDADVLDPGRDLHGLHGHRGPVLRRRAEHAGGERRGSRAGS